MKNLTILILLALTGVFAISGCKKTAPTQNSDPESTASAEVDPETLPKVDVAQDGTEFDPSVAVAQLPDGVWTCDMAGLSHYASHDKKDGKCPICHMDLVQKTATK